MNNSFGKISHKEWSNLTDVVSHVLTLAKSLGATEAEAAGAMEVGLKTSVRMGETETVEFNQDKTIGITVYCGKKKGTSRTTDISREALQSAVKAAIEIAQLSEEDKASGLPDEDSVAKNIPDLDLYHPIERSPENFIRLALECEEAARSVDSRITNSEGATFASNNHFRVYGHSKGFLGHYPTTSHSLVVSVIGKEKDSMERDYDYTVARAFEDLTSKVQVGKNAALRTLRRLNARKLKTCQVPVIFAKEVATGLISHFVSAISGSSLYRKSSFLLDHLEKPVFPKFMQIEENPHLHRAIGSAPFDQEGVTTQKRMLVQEGILKGYVLSTYSARKLGLKTTGNSGGVHNLILSHSDKDLPQLLKEMNKGLLVTELMGHGINIVTGDYSRGAFGFWVENGEIQYPVHEITIAGNLKDMFSNIVAIGNDIERRSQIFTGSIWLEKMTIAGN